MASSKLEPSHGHEGHQEVLAEGQFAVVGRRAVGQDVAGLDLVALVDQRPLVDAGRLVGAAELGQPVGLAADAAVVLDGDRVAGDLGHPAVGLGHDQGAGVAGRPALHARPDVGGLGSHEGHGLLLHVGAHERPVGVVVLQERDEGRGHRHDLLRRHVHVVDPVGADELHLTLAGPDEDAVVEEAAVLVDGGVGLGDDVPVLVVGGEVLRLVGDLAGHDLPVRRLGEAEPVDPGVAGQRADEADVRTFRRLDGAHPAVVGRVHVTNLEAGPLPGETAGAEGREAPLVGQAGQRVRLVHELRQLRGPEELLDGGHDRPDVDERLGRDGLDVLRGHALPDDPLHPGQADADLVLDELAHRPDPAVAEVVDVVVPVVGLAGVELHQVGDRGQDVGPGQA